MKDKIQIMYVKELLKSKLLNFGKMFFETSPITASTYKVHKTALRDQYRFFDTKGIWARIEGEC